MMKSANPVGGLSGRELRAVWDGKGLFILFSLISFLLLCLFASLSFPLLFIFSLERAILDMCPLSSPLFHFITFLTPYSFTSFFLFVFFFIVLGKSPLSFHLFFYLFSFLFLLTFIFLSYSGGDSWRISFSFLSFILSLFRIYYFFRFFFFHSSIIY